MEEFMFKMIPYVVVIVFIIVIIFLIFIGAMFIATVLDPSSIGEFLRQIVDGYKDSSP